MPAPLRRSLFEITDEEPLETYALEGTPWPAEASGDGPGAADRNRSVDSTQRADDPTQPTAPGRWSLPLPKIATVGAGAALATGLVVALHLLLDTGDTRGRARERAKLPSATPRIGPAPPALGTDRGRAPRRASGRDSRRIGSAEAKPATPSAVAHPAVLPRRPVAAPISASLPALPEPSVAPIAPAAGEEFGIER